MADFSFGTSMTIMRKTAPFVVFRVLVALAYVLVTGTKAPSDSAA